MGIIIDHETDDEFDAFMDKIERKYAKKPTIREICRTAKLLHILLAIAFIGFVVPLAVLVVGIGALGLLAAIKG